MPDFLLPSQTVMLVVTVFVYTVYIVHTRTKHPEDNATTIIMSRAKMKRKILVEA